MDTPEKERTANTQKEATMFAGICLMLVMLIMLVAGMFAGPLSTGKIFFLLSRICFWIVLTAMFWYALKIEKQKFLLYEEQKYPLLKAVLMGNLLAAALILTSLITNFIFKYFDFSIDLETKHAYNLFQADRYLVVFTCITAGVAEELLMRGYLQTRLEKLCNNALAGIFISSLIFGILHVSGGVLHIVETFFLGVVFATFYYKYRNMKILILVHIFYDLFVIWF